MIWKICSKKFPPTNCQIKKSKGVAMQYQKGSWSRLALHLSGIAGKQTEKVHQDVTSLILIHSQLAKVNWPNCSSAYTCKTKLRGMGKLVSEGKASPGLQLANARRCHECAQGVLLHAAALMPVQDPADGNPSPALWMFIALESLSVIATILM